MSDESDFNPETQILDNEEVTEILSPQRKKRRIHQNNQWLPPPPSGDGDTIVVTNPFDDSPSTVNRNNPIMGMSPNSTMGASNMNGPMTPGIGVGSPNMHSPNFHPLIRKSLNSMMGVSNMNGSMTPGMRMGSPNMHSPNFQPPMGMRPNNRMGVSNMNGRMSPGMRMSSPNMHSPNFQPPMGMSPNNRMGVSNINGPMSPGMRMSSPNMHGPNFQPPMGMSPNNRMGVSNINGPMSPGMRMSSPNMHSPNFQPPMGMSPNNRMGVSNMNGPMSPDMGMGSPMMHSPSIHPNPHLTNHPMRRSDGSKILPHHLATYIVPMPKSLDPFGIVHKTMPPRPSPIEILGPGMRSMAENGHMNASVRSPKEEPEPINGQMKNRPVNDPMHDFKNMKLPRPSLIGDLDQVLDSITVNGQMNESFDHDYHESVGSPLGGPTPNNGPMLKGPVNGPMPEKMNMNTPSRPLELLISPTNAMNSKSMPVGAGNSHSSDYPIQQNNKNGTAIDGFQDTNESSTLLRCGLCGGNITAESILCMKGCGLWFHRGCSGLTPRNFRLMTCSAKIHWICYKCQRN